MIISTALHA